MTQFYQIANLDEAGAERIQQLEQDLGRHIMAFEPGLNIADLSEEQLAHIKALEKELGVTLLVYQT